MKKLLSILGTLSLIVVPSSVIALDLSMHSLNNNNLDGTNVEDKILVSTDTVEMSSGEVSYVDIDNYSELNNVKIKTFGAKTNNQIQNQISAQILNGKIKISASKKGYGTVLISADNIKSYKQINIAVDVEYDANDFVSSIDVDVSSNLELSLINYKKESITINNFDKLKWPHINIINDTFFSVKDDNKGHLDIEANNSGYGGILISAANAPSLLINIKVEPKPKVDTIELDSNEPILLNLNSENDHKSIKILNFDKLEKPNLFVQNKDLLNAVMNDNGMINVNGLQEGESFITINSQNSKTPKTINVKIIKEVIENIIVDKNNFQIPIKQNGEVVISNFKNLTNVKIAWDSNFLKAELNDEGKISILAKMKMGNTNIVITAENVKNPLFIEIKVVDDLTPIVEIKNELQAILDPLKDKKWDIAQLQTAVNNEFGVGEISVQKNDATNREWDFEDKWDKYQFIGNGTIENGLKYKNKIELIHIYSNKIEVTKDISLIKDDIQTLLDHPISGFRYSAKEFQTRLDEKYGENEFTVTKLEELENENRTSRQEYTIIGNGTFDNHFKYKGTLKLMGYSLVNTNNNTIIIKGATGSTDSSNDSYSVKIVSPKTGGDTLQIFTGWHYVNDRKGLFAKISLINKITLEKEKVKEVYGQKNNSTEGNKISKEEWKFDSKKHILEIEFMNSDWMKNTQYNDGSWYVEKGNMANKVRMQDFVRPYSNIFRGYFSVN